MDNGELVESNNINGTRHNYILSLHEKELDGVGNVIIAEVVPAVPERGNVEPAVPERDDDGR